MRPLTDTETQTLLAKLANYTGNSLKSLIAPLEDGDRYVFRLHKDRVCVRHLREPGCSFTSFEVLLSLYEIGTERLTGHGCTRYYVRLSIANLATSIAREKLMSLGTCLGKFTKVRWALAGGGPRQY